MRCSGETSSSSMIKGDLAAVAVAVTFGANLGKTSQLQLLVAAFIEVIFYSTNLAIGTRLLQAVDSGSSISIYVHVFGAFFFFFENYFTDFIINKVFNVLVASFSWQQSHPAFLHAFSCRAHGYQASSLQTLELSCPFLF